MIAAAGIAFVRGERNSIRRNNVASGRSRNPIAGAAEFARDRNASVRPDGVN